MSESPVIHTVGTLAKLFNVPVHRILYVINTRGVQSLGVAGNARLYGEAAAQRIGSELRRIADDRSCGRARL